MFGGWLSQTEWENNTQPISHAEHVDDIRNLGKAKYFTMLDLKSGYHPIILAEHDREKTSFRLTGDSTSFSDCHLD